MKKNFTLFSVVLLSCIACKKDGNLDILSKNEFKVDSLLVKDSIKIGESLKLNYESTILTFPTLEDKTLLDSIYAPYTKLKDYSEQSIQKYIQTEKNSFFNSIKDQHSSWMVSAGYTDQWYEKSQMKVKSNINDFLHIQYQINSYMGGAHGNYGYREKVFDLDNNKRLVLSDITTISKDELSKLLFEHLNANKKPLQTVKVSDMLLVDKIPVTDNFYFDKDNLYFHYSPYEITAYAAGDVTIPIPWNAIKNTLNSDFASRMKL